MALLVGERSLLLIVLHWSSVSIVVVVVVVVVVDPSAAPPLLFRLARSKFGCRAGAPTKIRLAAPPIFSGWRRLKGLSSSSSIFVHLSSLSEHKLDTEYNKTSSSAMAESLRYACSIKAKGRF